MMTVSNKTKVSDFIEMISNIIVESSLVTAGEMVLVACSGGVDSMVLLDLLDRLGKRSGFSVSAAHLDHSFRGVESEQDQGLVARFCREKEILFMGGKEDVASFSKEMGLSFQDAGRRIRYTFLRESLLKINGDKIATAHHSDDQVETVLMRILRGTGPVGLRGIPVKGEGCYIRPLLHVWKSDIRNYAETMAVPYREDPGNQEDHYHRNRIRNVLLPLLEDYNPAVKEALMRLSVSIGEEREVIDDYIDETLKHVGFTKKEREVRLKRRKLLGCHPFVIKELVKRALISLEVEYSPESKNLALVLDFIKCAQSGKRLDLPSGFIIGRDFDEIYITSKEYCREKPADEVLIIGVEPGWNGKFQSRERTWRVRVDRPKSDENDDFKGNSFCQYFDFKDLDPPLRLRRWRPGDCLAPIGMDGRKKVSDLLAEGKVPLRKREDVLVLEDEKAILWVVGVRRSSRGLISRVSKGIVSISLESCDY